MTEEQKNGFQKRKAIIEKQIAAMTSGQEEYDQSSLASLYYGLGAANDALEDYDEAIRCYNEGLSYIENCLDEDDLLLSGLYDGLRDAYEKKEDYKKAIEYALKSSKNSMEYYLSDPEGSFTYILDLCCLYLQAGDYFKAKIYLDRAAGHEYSDEEIENRTAQLDYWRFVYYNEIDDIENALAYGEKAYKEIVEAYGADIEQAQYVKTELDHIKMRQQ